MKTRILALLILFGAVLQVNSVQAQTKQREKIQKSTVILTEFKQMEESIPEQLFQQAQGMIIIPGLINAGLGVGGKRGKGIALVKDSNGAWSDPVFVTLTGGSIGLQAGVQSVDLVLIFKSRSTLLNIGKGTFNLGGDISVAAGPVGRSSTADTDYKLTAEVYSYSRSKGLFAGISLNGSAIEIDNSANTSFYGRTVTAASVFSKSTSKSSDLKSLKAVLAGY